MAKKKEEISQRKGNELITMILILMIFIILILLITNKSFFTSRYRDKTAKGRIEINLPLFTFFKKEENKELYFTSLKNKKSIEKHLEAELASSKYTLYQCKNHKGPIYYNVKHQFFLYDVEVKTSGLLKDINIKYGQKEADRICEIFDDSIPAATKSLYM